MNFVDRRLNPKGKSHTNRQRFIRLARETLKEAVVRSIKERALGDVDTKEVVNIPRQRIQEPRFRHSGKGGNREHVLPGNKEFVQGDTLPKPEEGAGGRGREASDQGEGEDNFQFTLSRDEYLDILFEELELPDLAKTLLKEATALRTTRAGFSATGSPSNLNLVRTMRHSLARRIALHRPKQGELAEIEAEISRLRAQPNRSATELQHLTELVERYERLARRTKYIAFIDPIDLRYNRYEPTPKPNAQAVMFCLMDVSASMSEYMKDLAKRFFLLLHLFLTRKYEHVDIVFIRHTSEAKEVDEETFFRSTETGATVVSTALTEMRRIVAERYPVDEWNIYAAQASDGYTQSGDARHCVEMLNAEVMPLCQYYAYIEILDEREMEVFASEDSGAELWRAYRTVAELWPNFATKRISRPADIFPVFHELFKKTEATA